LTDHTVYSFNLTCYTQEPICAYLVNCKECVESLAKFKKRKESNRKSAKRSKDKVKQRSANLDSHNSKLETNFDALDTELETVLADKEMICVKVRALEIQKAKIKKDIAVSKAAYQAKQARES
jgi:hypothetical protein